MDESRSGDLAMADAHDKIAVVDFGGQYAHLIATKVRRQKVLAEIRQPEDPVTAFDGYQGIILSGSPSLASRGEDSDWNKDILDLDVPILGFCFGHQSIAEHYGGKVIHGGREWGAAKLHLHREHALFKGLTAEETVWMSHFDSVAELGPDFEELGYTVTGTDAEPHRNAAIGSDKLRRYGFQFHPEVDATVGGETMIRNFVLDICDCRPSWNMNRFLEEEVARIQAQVGDGSVFLLASGGVDSTVAAKILGMALPADRLALLHVDNGLMRKDESQNVIEMFKDLGLGHNLHFIDATDDFLGALEGVIEPEAKRHRIGDTFIAVFDREAKRLGIENHLLGQGTIYPDTIETGATKRSVTIKTHHNRVPIIEQLIAQGRVVEPLADLYKTEVRELGIALGVPAHAIERHPFPGPGLGVRLLCSDGRTTAPDVGAALAEIGARFGVDAAALPLRSVGVKADLRVYEHPVMITGDLPFETILEASRVMLSKVPDINRVIWNLRADHPATCRPLVATMTRERLDLLREVDHQVMEGLHRHNLYNIIWQCPTVLVPLEIDGRGRELVVIRPVHSQRAMTASPATLPTELLDELRRGILSLEGVSGLSLDLTSKPPGTIEWE
jgi:GMP synthase (glutamine-hydrolysing)